MAQTLGNTGTADPIAAEYLTWESAGGSFAVHMHREAIDGLSRDVLENSAGLPVEVGGLLLGHASRGERTTVWIERYHRLACRHSLGPHFILDDEDRRNLRQSAELSGDLSVVGMYRSHLRPGFQLEPPDFELTDRYFKDPEDIFLLIGTQAGELLAQFFLHDEAASGAVRPADPPFPFRGRVLTQVLADPAERTERTAAAPPAPVPPPRRRLVPDFDRTPEPATRPAREFFMESRPSPSLLLTPTEDLTKPRDSFLRRRGPLLAALLLVAGGMAFFVQQTFHHDATPPAAAPGAAAVRPLGLHVDTSGPGGWRISWSPTATALRGARSVKLFARDGDEQNLIELTPKDLQSGRYEYRTSGQDVTFRLEVSDAEGKVSAESFRLLKATEPPALPTVPVAAPPTVARPKPTRRVAPVVPLSIRPRIKGRIPVDVRVKIDAQGRVNSATPLTRAHNGLETFLIGRAVEAARQWRYEPAPPASEIIHFNFEK